MRWKEYIHSELDIPEKDLPNGYQRVGDVLILNLPEKLLDKKKEIGEKTLEFLPKMKTVCINRSKISGEFRKPEIERIAGDGTETIHKENGYELFLDVRKVMFSKGNTKERNRMKKVTRGVVLDMFAGIGYFSIPAGMNDNVRMVHAIEKNPESYRFLAENIMRNQSRVKPYLGDCRDVLKSMRIRADAIIMGLLPSPFDFLDYALKSLKRGGTIYYHTIHDVDKDINEVLGKIRESFEKNGFKIKNIRKNRVKKYAPRVEHLVLDLSVSSS
jgi:tRNA wybutosine-synthesizing protein 2